MTKIFATAPLLIVNLTVFTVFVTSVFQSDILSDTLTSNVTASTYELEPSFNDTICSLSERISQQPATSWISCSVLCSSHNECVGVFYKAGDRTCTLCSGNTVVLVDVGTVFLKRRKGDVCKYPGQNYDDHVVILSDDSNLYAGAVLEYTCKPCSYFPPLGSGIMTCQENGTWTTPTCVYGPDVGMFSKMRKNLHGQMIPPSALGCVSVLNTTCWSGQVENGFFSNGTTGLCFCDTVCCDLLDCCYDQVC